MRDVETRAARGRRTRRSSGLWPVWLAGLSLTLAGVFVALKLDGSTGSIEPHRYERFVDSLRESDSPG